jgi:hypothetical protein
MPAMLFLTKTWPELSLGVGCDSDHSSLSVPPVPVRMMAFIVEGTDDMVRLGVVSCILVIGPDLGRTGARCDAVSASLEVVLVVSNGRLDLRMGNDMKLHAIIGGWEHLITEHVKMMSTGRSGQNTRTRHGFALDCGCFSAHCAPYTISVIAERSIESSLYTEKKIELRFRRLASWS